ncbi:MAG: tetratricopeptide repeat protein, partial [Rhodospirillales bacterium]|nr:tetratricopeptide repeat protein [Rhodospirillales bacterium]
MDILQEIIDLQLAGKIPEALNVISENLHAYADKPELYLLTAVCSYRRNAIGQAIELCEKAHQIDPENQEVVDSLAVLKTISGNLNEGLYYAKLATTLSPHRDIPDLLPLEFSSFFYALSIAAPSRHYLDGLYLFNGRQFPAAITEFEAELQINPDNMAAMKMLGHAQLFVGQPDDALNNLSRFAEKYPDDAEIPVLSAMAHCMRADFDAAHDMCQVAIEMDPESIKTLSQVLE